MLDLKDNKSLHHLFQHQHVFFAYLFGSQSRGNTGRLSDIDIAVYFGQCLTGHGEFEKKLQLLGQLNDYFKTDDIDLVVLNDAPCLLAHRIIKEGQLIYSLDNKIRMSYEVRAVLNYLDWKPFLDKYAQQTLGVPSHG